ncbi:sigma-70 family RNA polymerase sigma factor [Gimesia algae]|uniref:RNA polymerase sigma factor SigZ n=1 Tax=Gimesia algae TaxID=2527971 RepID=A0A517VFZ2_9PLAN|nr:sigma-70 family RNA polymerase sigma factor [Gimesia algae]QDT91943.1 RNA polymerase sigma factor SigZ [Gimesia algae]
MSADTDLQSDAAQLLVHYKAPLYAYIHASVRNRSDADDIFQEVSVAVVESFSKLDTDAGFFPWAREIAFRRVLSYYRKYDREKPVNPQLIAVLAEAAERVEQNQPVSTRREKLLECLDRLPEVSRALIARCYDNSGESLGAIAAQSGLKVTAFYARIHRIRAILRECIAQRLLEESVE